MFIYYAIAAAIIAADQFTKWLVLQNMELGERIPVVEPYFAWLSHRNRGAAWGMLEGQMWLFAIITVAVIIGILYYFHKYSKGQPLLQLSLMIILGGAVGNFIDRMLRGEVVDFVDVLIPGINYHFPIFNIADAALTIGVILMIIFVIYDEKQQKKKVS
ncbi:signal peptidase II [Planococcus beigongshangi]|uniref:signal peptidase II n=1 Tax=Planococcus beigongshangi TaxID=2782536 RepID=UPI00193BFFCE|nr:signal peptidase II [Planococcus beigongshangi]